MTGTDCKTYIVQNNNWGRPTGSTQVVNYTGSSFTVRAAAAPVVAVFLSSFPST